LSNLGKPLRQAVDSALRPWIMEAFAPGPRVALAALGEDVVPVGALTLAAAQERGFQSEAAPVSR
jgi:glucokinase